MFVNPKREIEVIGTGCLTIVDVSQAEGRNKVLGYEARGVRVSCLQAGDRFVPETNLLTVHPDKKVTADPTDGSRGNFLIGDIGAEGTVPFAVFSGLADNSSRKQVGVTFTYTNNFGHGYRFTFRKDAKSVCWIGPVDNLMSFAVHNIDLTIEPVLSNLRSPRDELPVDLPQGVAEPACLSLWFRGIFLTDDKRCYRPDAAITRAELATALARIAHLLPPAGEISWPSDVSEGDPWADDDVKMLESKLMECDSEGRFHPHGTISRQEAARLLVRFYEIAYRKKLPDLKPAIRDISQVPGSLQAEVNAAIDERLLTLESGRFRPAGKLTRLEATEAICRMIRLSY